MSVFGRVLKSLTGVFRGTPEPVSAPRPVPEEVPHERQVSNYDQPEVTYPRGWGQADRAFWDAEVPPDYRRYYSEDEWDNAQEAFEQGWMYPSRSQEAVQEYRDRFFDISTMDQDQFDWQAFREWYAAQ
jgi:hypothetical protein